MVKIESRQFIRLMILALAISTAACVRHSPSTRLHFIVPNGKWGYFVVRPNVKLSPGGVQNIEVPFDGMGPEVPEDPYTFEVTFADGTPIYSAYTDERQNVPPIPSNVIRMDWPQVSDVRGHLFFVGTEDQYQANRSQNPPLGLKSAKLTGKPDGQKNISTKSETSAVK